MSTEMTEAPANGAINRIRSAATETAITREASEVQAAMLVAQRCPRDEIEAERRILQACKRIGLAECAMYAYPRGGTKVTGPSIRLAETMARHWGNMSYGVKELAQRPGESDLMAYAWDMETNVRVEKIFTAKHERDKGGGTVKVDGPRDVYEVTANQGSRRVRACILAIIPGDIVDRAVEECEKTLKGQNDKPLVDRIKVAIEKFEQLGVTKAQLEKRVGHKIETLIEVELVQLVKVYRSIVDGAAKKEEFFPPEAGATPKQSEAAAAVQKEILGDDKSEPVQPKPEPARELVDLHPDADQQADDLIERASQAKKKTDLEKVRGDWMRVRDGLGETLSAKVKAAIEERAAALAK